MLQYIYKDYKIKVTLFKYNGIILKVVIDRYNFISRCEYRYIFETHLDTDSDELLKYLYISKIILSNSASKIQKIFYSILSQLLPVINVPNC